MKKIKESEDVTSFYLKSKDGKEMAIYKPGQYLTLKATIPGEKYTHIRHYSISEAPGKDYYRISVKREDDDRSTPEGIVSNYLHNEIKEGDILLFSAPAGDFVLDTKDTSLVLVSGELELLLF
ncbi:FAD-binding oxidoreductase [Niallia circulans]